MYRILFLSLSLLVGCQSVEHFSIDYLQPAEVSFPDNLKRVAVVDNVPRLDAMEKAMNGTLTSKALAQALANENYFEEVIVCDSAWSTGKTLGVDAVSQLSSDLGVDFLISLDKIQMKVERKFYRIPEWGVIQGRIEARLYPTVRVYIPGRKTPMVTIQATDSVYWEEYGATEKEVEALLPKEEELIKQASEYAGSIPVRRLLPHWKNASRLLFVDGSVNMRDGAVFAKEYRWEEAVHLWKKEYNAKRGKAKHKMYVAHNLALGYEMQDSIVAASAWMRKAMDLAKEVSKQDPTYDIYLRDYAAELKKREEGLMRLNLQMDRFE